MHKLLHLFIPYHHNNHRAKLLWPSYLLVLIAVYIFNQSLIRSLIIFRPGILGYSSEITAQKVFDYTNTERQKAGLPALKYNSTLSQSALAKARDMFAANYWAHNSPSGKVPWDFFRAAGYQYSLAGENLAKDFYDTDTMVRAWMNSPTHKANIVNPKYQEIGIGVVNGVLFGVKTTLVVQHFGTPVAARIAEKPTLPQASPAVSTVLADSDLNLVREPPLFSPLQVSQAVGAALFIIILMVLVVDGYVTYRTSPHRLTGSTIGHFSFLFLMLLVLLISRSGTIF